MSMQSNGRAVFLDQGTLIGRKVDDVNDWADASQRLDFSVLESVFPQWDYYDQTSPDKLAEHLDGAQVVVTNKVVLGRSQLEAAVNHNPALELVCISATGVNNVDLAAAKDLGVAVSNVKAYATSSVTEHVFGLLLQLARHLPEYQRAIAAAHWQQSPHFSLLDYPITELAGRKIGIIGYGELGRSVAVVAEAFGMQVLVCEWPGVEQEQRPFDQLIAEVDVLTLHCPLNQSTQHLIGARELEKMKPHALLINTARGGIVDESALYAALVKRQIGGAAIDVLAEEPPSDDHVLLRQAIPNLIVTPHIAWASIEVRQRLINEIAQNIQSWQSGGTRNRVV